MKTFEVTIQSYVDDKPYNNFSKKLYVKDSVKEDDHDAILEAFHEQCSSASEFYKKSYPSHRFEITKVETLSLPYANKPRDEILPIEFTTVCPETVHHVFGFNPKDYDRFHLPDFIYKGVKRYPDWLVDELAYWNQFRGRTVSSSGYSPYDPYRDEGDEKEITRKGEHIIQSEGEIEGIKERFLYGGLEVPKDLEVGKTFGMAYPDMKEPDDKESSEDDSDDYGYIRDSAPIGFVDALGPFWLGNLAEYFKDLSIEEKQIGILLRTNRHWSLLCEQKNILVVCDEHGKPAGFERLQQRDLEDTTMLAPATITPGTDLSCDGPNHTILVLLSVEALKNSPSKGERVVICLTNSDESTDDYGYCY